MEQKVIIEAKNLVKTYGEGEGLMYALNNVSIKVYEHDFLVILGGSGSGKSTFLNMLPDGNASWFRRTCDQSLPCT